MKPTLKEKLFAFVAVMAGTGAFIFISMHLMVGVMGACK